MVHVLQCCSGRSFVVCCDSQFTQNTQPVADFLQPRVKAPEDHTQVWFLLHLFFYKYNRNAEMLNMKCFLLFPHSESAVESQEPDKLLPAFWGFLIQI